MQESYVNNPCLFVIFYFINFITEAFSLKPDINIFNQTSVCNLCIDWHICYDVVYQSIPWTQRMDVSFKLQVHDSFKQTGSSTQSSATSHENPKGFSLNE